MPLWTEWHQTLCEFVCATSKVQLYCHRHYDYLLCPVIVLYVDSSLETRLLWAFWLDMHQVSVCYLNEVWLTCVHFLES